MMDVDLSDLIFRLSLLLRKKESEVALYCRSLFQAGSVLSVMVIAERSLTVSLSQPTSLSLYFLCPDEEGSRRPALVGT